MTGGDDRALDLGLDHYATPILDAAGELVGCVLDHPDAERPGRRCRGPVHFDTPAAQSLAPERSRWTVVSLDPLSLTPCLLCTRCGDQGWIQVNRWKPFRR